MDCLFCKIAKKEIPSQIVFENDEVLVFKDIQPQAPIHWLLIPKEHSTNINDVSSAKIFSSIFQVVKDLATQHGFAQKGYRTVINTNPEGGQSVYHLHLHLLAGQQMGPSMVG